MDGEGRTLQDAGELRGNGIVSRLAGEVLLVSAVDQDGLATGETQQPISVNLLAHVEEIDREVVCGHGSLSRTDWTRARIIRSSRRVGIRVCRIQESAGSPAKL